MSSIEKEMLSRELNLNLTHFKPNHSSILENLSLENILEVRSLTMPFPVNDLYTSISYDTFFINNCGKPSNLNSLAFEERRTRYPVINYESI